MTSSKRRTYEWVDGTQLTEAAYKRKLAVQWWDPDVARTLPPAELRHLQQLKWWRPENRSFLSAAALAAYRDRDERLAMRRVQVTPTEKDIKSISDPLERLQAAEDAQVAFDVMSRRMGDIRREALMQAAMSGEPTKKLADVIRTTMANVRQLILKEKRSRGLPIPPAYGGHQSRAKSA